MTWAPRPCPQLAAGMRLPGGAGGEEGPPGTHPRGAPSLEGSLRRAGQGRWGGTGIRPGDPVPSPLHQNSPPTPPFLPPHGRGGVRLELILPDTGWLEGKAWGRRGGHWGSVWAHLELVLGDHVVVSQRVQQREGAVHSHGDLSAVQPQEVTKHRVPTCLGLTRRRGVWGRGAGGPLPPPGVPRPWGTTGLVGCLGHLCLLAPALPLTCRAPGRAPLVRRTWGGTSEPEPVSIIPGSPRTEQRPCFP